jgi:acetyl-CoA acetyltransferase
MINTADVVAAPLRHRREYQDKYGCESPAAHGRAAQQAGQFKDEIVAE